MLEDQRRWTLVIKVDGKEIYVNITGQRVTNAILSEEGKETRMLAPNQPYKLCDDDFIEIVDPLEADLNVV